MKKISYKEFIEFISDEFLDYEKISKKFNIKILEVPIIINELINLVGNREISIEEKKIELVKIPEDSDHMTMEDWISCVEDGLFIDYDGFGYYATETEMLRDYDKKVNPSDVKCGTIDKSWTHIVWFNK